MPRSDRSRLALALTALAALVLFACGDANAVGGARSAGDVEGPVSRTEVIEFEPGAVPANIARDGHCLTRSVILFARDDAWRCTDDHRIADPCFEVDGVVVCGADPIGGDPGYQLRLTAPLPARETPDEAPGRYWLLELEGGTICGFAAGSSATIDGERLNYYCSDGGAVLGDVVHGAPYTVRHLPREQAAAGGSAAEATTLAVRRAWR